MHGNALVSLWQDHIDIIRVCRVRGTVQRDQPLESRTIMNLRIVLAVSIVILPNCVSGGEPVTLPVWPGKPPGETLELAPEVDIYKATDQKIAGRRIIKLANVSKPTLEIFRPAKEKNTGAAVVICPGGGHHILAYDLEGTEVARWLSSIGVTGIVLKYRVPARDKDKRWRAAVQDAQRAMSVARGHASEWQVDPQRIGICGFSAGGETAGLTAVFGNERTYQASDKTDQVSCRPDFAILIYAAGFVTEEEDKLRAYVRVNSQTPPMFLVHAYDDQVSPMNSILLFSALKKARVAGELHVFSKGGHGYGLRETDAPVTRWPDRCVQWMKAEGLLEPASKSK